MDPNNPVVRLCADGMRAEGEGRPDEARALFMEAWSAQVDDYDACIAAHYVARHQETDRETLHWNEEALRRADAIPDDRVHGFYPSLLLNLAHSHELLGDVAEARRFYELAAARLDAVPAGAYGDMVRDGVARGLERSRA
jgi:hypothetical protein